MDKKEKKEGKDKTGKKDKKEKKDKKDKKEKKQKKQQQDELSIDADDPKAAAKLPVEEDSQADRRSHCRARTDCRHLTFPGQSKPTGQRHGGWGNRWYQPSDEQLPNISK